MQPKNFATLKRSLILAFLIIIPIVFIFGFSGLVAISLNPNVVPDLAFFSLVLNKNDLIISVTIIFIAISLTVSSIDTIMNAVSSLIIVDTKKIINLKYDSIHTSKYLVSFLAVITFLISSQGISILYLFLIADLFCCAAVFSVFYSFYTKSPNEKNIYLSIVIGLIGGILFFPSTDYSKSVLVGILMPTNFFPILFRNHYYFFLFSSYYIACNNIKGIEFP